LTLVLYNNSPKKASLIFKLLLFLFKKNVILNLCFKRRFLDG